MEVKDIAMSIRKSVELPKDRSILSMLDFADRVAEISFKAGMREVVELLKVYNPQVGSLLRDFEGLLETSEWQAKLKEWGIG